MRGLRRPSDDQEPDRPRVVLPLRAAARRGPRGRLREDRARMVLATASPPRVLESILEAIGRTPLVRLRLPGVPVGLALVGRAKGYPVELVMPDSVTEERKGLCTAYGARIIYTDAFSGSDGALRRVREMIAADSERYFYADQYRNPANPLAHYRTTGPEIWEQTAGRLTHFVAGLGTTGIVVGTGRYLHERNPHVRVVAVEPDEPLHGLEGLKHLPSAIVPEIWDETVPDERDSVSTENALATCEEVMATNGLFIGHSAGAAVFAARERARALRSGVVVALLCDGGERYLSGRR